MNTPLTGTSDVNAPHRFRFAAPVLLLGRPDPTFPDRCGVEFEKGLCGVIVLLWDFVESPTRLRYVRFCPFLKYLFATIKQNL